LLDARENSEQAEQLEILSILVEDYESKHYKIEMPDPIEPIEAINFRLEQLGLLRKDLEKSIGSRGRVSEILNKKRNLTLSLTLSINDKKFT
jgi:HTH-type transcriptional regulator/antitoxin HigA